jgi:cell division protein FtsL
MAKNIYLYLFVLSALLAVFIYYNSTRIIQDQENTIRELKAKIENLEAKK